MIRNEKEKELQEARDKIEAIEKEQEKGIDEISLNKLRDTIKRGFPDIEFKETSESIKQLMYKKHRCSSCIRYVKQTSLEIIDLKFENSEKYREEIILFRLFDNPNEQLEASKGYCITHIPTIHKTVKTIINTPNMSVCTEWQLHPDISKYFGKLSEKLRKIREKKLAQEKIDSQEKIEFENAKKIVDAYNSRIIKRGRGRPSTDPSKKTYYEE